MFAPVQEKFSGALLDPGRPVPGALTSHSARVPERRFAVYRNNVTVGLVNALATRFPAVQRIVGEDFFRDMARVYVRAHPPRSRLLMEYGEDFADFIAGFEPVAELEYLADVARLEAARTRAFHAADAAPADAKPLESIAASVLGNLRIEPHPSAQIVRSNHPVVTIWAMNAGERELEAIDDWRGEDALVMRPHFDVFVHALLPGGAVFLSALFGGSRLAEAIEAAYADHEAFDLVANLAGLVSSGAAAKFIIPD
jgi:hypothetical protein